MSSSRKESVKRHLKLKHNEKGVIVSYNDYIIGRLSGNYFPTFSAISISPSLKKAVPEGVRPQAITSLDTFREGFLHELGVRAARKNFEHPSTWQGHPQGTFYQSSRPYTNIPPESNQPTFEKPEDIFALEIYVCDKCQLTKPRQICFFNNIHKMGQRKIEFSCPPSWMRTTIQPVAIRDEFFKTSRRLFPGFMQRLVRDLAPNTDKIQLVALKMPDLEPQCSSISIELTLTQIYEETKSNSIKSIGIPYSKDKCLDLELPTDKNHYIARVIKNKKIFLDDDELIDFLQKSSPSTFAFFRMKASETGISHIYLIAVIIAMNKDNKSNNGQLTLSLPNQMNRNVISSSQENQSAEQLLQVEQQKQNSEVIKNNHNEPLNESKSEVSEPPTILAYESYLCEKCLQLLGPTAIYSEKYQRDQIDALHECSPETLSKVQKQASRDVQYIVKRLTSLRKRQLEVVKEKVKEWTKNEPYLLAIRRPYPLRNSTTFSAIGEHNSGIARAIRDGRANLSELELEYFLKQSKGSTCLHIRIDSQQSAQHSRTLKDKPPDSSSSTLSCYYLVAIVSSTISAMFVEKRSQLEYL